ncbi:MAG TPA: redoxin family protein [Acidimicrobiia bacterium]|nr:redoxin family protein [Acidimicrobiia bacterium]
MAQTVKRTSPNGSKTFPIVISIVVLAMVGLVVLTITNKKDEVRSQSKLEVSETVQVSAVSLNGNLGESSLPSAEAKNEDGSDAASGMLVPQITAQDFSGKTNTVIPEGKPYVITFLAHWCPHCRKEVPAIVKLHDENKLPENVDFIAVATGTSEQQVNYPPSQWLLEENWPWKKLADDQNGSIAKAFGLTGYPYLIFVNADGTVSSRLSGEQDDAVYVAAANAIARTETTSK